MSRFPSHASPAFAPIRPSSLRDEQLPDVKALSLDGEQRRHDQTQDDQKEDADQAVNPQKHHQHRPKTSAMAAALASAAAAGAPPPLVSPSFTPPSTPGGSGSRTPSQLPTSLPVPVAVDTSLDAPDPLTSHDTPLPEVTCIVRARIPTTTGVEMFLHLYHNNVDSKEHLAIVFGSKIRSQSLDMPRDGESEWDRMVRGAYVGRLRPGRTSSRMDSASDDEGGEQSREGDNEDNAKSADPPLVRIHSACYTGETVWSARCDCGEQLDEAARLMSTPSPASKSPPSGVIVYLQQEGRGIGLASKLAAYNLQDLGSDTYEANILLRHPADARSYGLATAMLLDLGLGGERGVRLLTNNPDKVRAVEGPRREIRVRQRVPMVPLAWKTAGKKGVQSEEVEKYLSTKIEKFHHMLNRG